jgi:XTP/dITP diphosphohydrolase
MRRLLVATTNAHKLKEIRGLLSDVPVAIVGLDSLPPIEAPEETGATFEQNARLKAQYYSSALTRKLREEPGVSGFSRKIDLLVAEDSGLVIDALDGDPGVHSARFLRPDASYPERFAEIFRRLDACPERQRTARFVCALAVTDDAGVIFETRGTVEGEIVREPRGTAGFGYDPIFYFPAYGCTLAEVTEEKKLRVAHRGQAFRALAEWLRG